MFVFVGFEFAAPFADGVDMDGEVGADLLRAYP